MRARPIVGSAHPLRATVIHSGDPDRQRCERDLLARGVPLPVMHRLAWQSVDPSASRWFIAVRDGHAACRYGLGVQVARSRALAWHLLLRVERLDPATDLDACLAGLEALTDLARRRWPRVLRVYVELYSRDEDARAAAGERLSQLGFRRAAHARMYHQTAIVDLSGDDEALFARLHKTARRNVRAVVKSGLEIRTIVDPNFARRMDALIRESFARTGGVYHPENWEAIINLSRREPDLSRIAGLFLSGVDGPQAMLAFELACMHGDHAQSLAAGSTRAPQGRVPLAYAPVWDVMRWARARGARYLDFGGVTAGSHGSGDPLGGISDFKRSFGAITVNVGEEWTLEPHRFPARLAGIISRGVAAARGARGR